MNLGKSTGVILVIFQIALVIAFAFLVTFSDEADSKHTTNASQMTNMYYPMFQDIQVMILIGFGMLMMFMKRYSYSGGGLTFLMAAITFQYGLLLQRIVGPLKIGMPHLIEADITAAAVLISLGAVFGKTTPLQVFIMTLIEVPIYVGNKYLATAMKVSDIGGSVSVHTFGAYFGLAISSVLGKPKSSVLDQPSYQSDLFSVVGTLFLWIFWPSFNGAASWEDGQQRAVMNTYLSLTASCVMAFAFSTLTHNTDKFTMAHVQNATLAGGVAIGTVADLLLMPYAALLIGAVAGAMTTLGFVYVQPWLLKHLKLHDACGVNNLHGMPSILAGIAGAIIAAEASTESYGPRLFLLYPARAPLPSTQHLRNVQLKVDRVMPGEFRSASKQAIYQVLSLVFTILISIVSGAITGVVLKITKRWTGSVPDDCNYDDSLFWTLPEDVDKSSRTVSAEVTNVHTIRQTINSA